MGFIYGVHSERAKVRHTLFWTIHFCVPVMGALLFLIYYLLYGSTADSKKLKMILELTAMVFPLLTSVIVGLNVTLEERDSHFQTLLAVPNRYKNILALSFKFGLGLSLFWGVFESLQCILYSNIELKGIARYIPFAWSMSWIQDTLNQQFFSYGTEKVWIAVLMIGGLLLTLFWFSHWEGRKNYEYM